MNLKRALVIKGWMKPHELQWLAAQAKHFERIIEVGVFLGRTTRAILDNSQASVWCVDNWDQKWSGGYVGPKELEQFKRNVIDYMARVKILRMDSADGARLLTEKYSPGYFDMVFIDGGHDYATVKSDIALYSPLVRYGGLVCGHDYGRKAWPGVVQAVNEAFGKPDGVHYAIWWVEKD
jgi:predicted O-methyltransferase YrrM